MRVVFPDAASSDIWFAIDTGSAISVLVTSQSLTPGIASRNYAAYPTIVLGGVGGSKKAPLVPGTLYLDALEGRVSTVLRLALVPAEEAGALIPLLGRDFLDYVRVTIDRSAGVVRLSDAEGDLESDRWPDGERRA